MARIIIADGLATNRIALKSVLTTARHETRTAQTTDDVRALLRDGTASLLVLDLDLPGGALALLEEMKLARRVPVIVTMERETPELRIAALSAGADDIMMKPVAKLPLLARIRTLLRTSDTLAALAARAETMREMGFAEPGQAFEMPGRIAMVANEPSAAPLLPDRLTTLTRNKVEHLDSGRALKMDETSSAPDVYVLSARPESARQTLRLVSELRAQTVARHSAIVVLHDRDDPETGAMALDLGASAVIETGVSPEEFALTLDLHVRRKQEGDRLRAAVEERLRLAVEDPLTGLFNRRYAMAHLRRLAHETPVETCCVILADIDRFKSINDRFGHSAGDAVLASVARLLRDNVRAPDMVARIGGEEFMIVLRDSDPAAALMTAERLCELVRTTPVPCLNGKQVVHVTISLGLAMTKREEPVEEAIERADRALYEAKANGRDKVTVSPDSRAA